MEARAAIDPNTTVLDGDDTCFDPNTVYDRAYGALLGLALGEALGLQVEGDDAPTIAERHPGGLALPHGASRRGHAPNDWGDAADLTVLTMRTMAAYFSSQLDNPTADFATRVSAWHRGGFPELGDTAGLTPEAVVTRALAQPGFLADPVAAARAVRGPKAENGALIRTVACAFTAAPRDWAALFSEATHADERCTASAVALTLLVNSLARAPATPATAIGPTRAGRDYLAAAPARREDYMRRLTNSRALADLGLDERDNRSYTLKTLAVAMWALRQLVKVPAGDANAAFFKSVVASVAAQGGDASANAAVAGAVVGAALGHQRLPQDWLAALPHRAWLMKEIAVFVQAAELTWAK